MNPAIIFPAFVNEYSGYELAAISEHKNHFSDYLKQASAFLNNDLSLFDFEENNFLSDELKSQFISYIFSCAVADILKDNHIIPSFVSGYSMGIYASMYYCGAVTFLQGLHLIETAWKEISVVTTGNKYGMGMIVGLSENDISNLMSDIKDVDICNQNNDHTFIISGVLSSVNKILVTAKNEGALKTNFLPVTKPYHSKLLNNTIPAFKAAVYSQTFSRPFHKYISAMNQKIIESPDGLMNEVVENINCQMSWLNTMNFIISKNTTIIFECGAGNGLTRNTKFISGQYSMFHVGKLQKFLSSCNN
jgi:malonyl CoA-acyl carrier protein transacylase